MYLWYVYQPSCSKEKKGKGKGGEDEGNKGLMVGGKGGKSKREGKEKERREERKKERKERREKSHSRVRSSHGIGQRSRNQSACSATSTASSCSTVDSDDFDSGSEVFAGQYHAIRNEMDMGDLDFEMTDSESSASLSMALPPGLSMSQQFQLSTQNPMTQFVVQGHHGHGHGHSLSAQIPAQQIHNLGPPSVLRPPAEPSLNICTWCTHASAPAEFLPFHQAPTAPFDKRLGVELASHQSVIAGCDSGATAELRDACASCRYDVLCILARVAGIFGRRKPGAANPSVVPVPAKQHGTTELRLPFWIGSNILEC